MMKPPEKSKLTAREVEVIRLTARGMINKEIASSLGITEGTVKQHLTNIFGKLNAGNRMEAVNAFNRINLLD